MQDEYIAIHLGIVFSASIGQSFFFYKNMHLKMKAKEEQTLTKFLSELKYICRECFVISFSSEGKFRT